MFDKAVSLKPRDAGIYLAAAQFYWRRRRDAMSGVDLDREAADLIRLQQAYEASARVIQVARETMQSILNIF